jgi:hypothetical protein
MKQKPEIVTVAEECHFALKVFGARLPQACK